MTSYDLVSCFFAVAKLFDLQNDCYSKANQQATFQKLVGEKGFVFSCIWFINFFCIYVYALFRWVRPTSVLARRVFE